MRIGPKMSDTDQRIGPMPFSTEWIDDPPPPERPRRVPVGKGWLPASLPGWLPSERLLSAFLVLVLILGTAAFSSNTSATRELNAPDASGPAAVDTALVPNGPPLVAPSPAVVAGEPTTELAASGTDETANAASAPVSAASNPATGNQAAAGQSASRTDLTARQSGDFPRDADGNLFPSNRIVAYYGTSIDSRLGVLGMDTIDNTYAQLMDQVAEWQAADPDTNVIPTWEYIATVAQSTEQSDGTFLNDIPFDEIQPYIDFADEHGMLTFIDVQVGKRGVQGEVERLRPLLSQPNVMLAIDPEFAIHGDEIPGENYGYIGADDVNWAMQYLADLSRDEGIPQKVLMVHQFRYDMIQDKETIQDTPGVELVLHADGHGSPDLKQETYGVVITQWADQIAFWPGFKVFYNRDDPDLNQYTDIPNMTPDEILQLDPVPYYISYQ